MFELNTDNLTGKCLISSPFMQDEHFHKTVVYICSHGKDGAMGFIINQQIEDISFADLASQLPIGQFNNTRDFNLYNGGPLEKIRGFVIHSTDYIKGDTIVVDKQIAVSSSIDIISDIAFGMGPKENIIALGYSSWGPQQLEKEIMNNNWIVTSPGTDLVFHTKAEEKWETALREAGINIDQLSQFSGRD